MYVHLAKIETSFPFPVDMLRYDQCWPIKETHAGLIERSHHPGGPREPYIVEVSTIRSSKEIPWTFERWNSFQCRVNHLETHKM